MAGDCSRRSARCGACLPCGRRVCTARRGPRSLLRLGRTVVTYWGCFRWSPVAFAAVAGLVVGGTAAGVLLPTGPAATAVHPGVGGGHLAGDEARPSCGTSGGGPGRGDAGTREPRRPKPGLPGGAIALPLNEDPPAVA